MKGRANYLCLHRLDQLNEGQRPRPSRRRRSCRSIRDWAAQHRDRRSRRARGSAGGPAVLERGVGDRRDLPRHRVPALRRLLRHADAAARRRVRRGDRQPSPALRRRRGPPERLRRGDSRPAATPIVDEAHQLEDIATQYFGFSVSTYRARGLRARRRAVRQVGRRRHAATRRTRLQKGDRPAARSRARASSPSWRSRTAPTERVRGEERVRATDASLGAHARGGGAIWPARSTCVEAALGAARSRGARRARRRRRRRSTARRSARRAGEIRDELRFLLRAGDPAYVYFVEFRGKGVFLRASPIDVSAIVRELLLDRMRATVLTSATLTVDGTFDYVRGRLGIAHADEVRLPSEFDYATQAILYLPPRMPDPRSPEFAMAAGTAGRRDPEAQPRARVRAVHELRGAARGPGDRRDGARLSDARPGHRAAVAAAHGSSARRRNSVLFATSSFWQGVDVVGEALSCVIVDKLPFASPGDPITAARIDAIRAQRRRAVRRVPGAAGDPGPAAGARAG